MGLGGSKIVELSGAIDSANTQLEKNKSVSILVDKQLDELKTNINTSIKELQICNDSLNDHRKKIIKNRSDSSEIMTKHMATEKELELEVLSQKRELNSLNEEKVKLDIQSQKLKSELKTRIQKNTEYVTRIKALIGEVGKNNDKLKELQELQTKTQAELLQAQSKGSSSVKELTKRRDELAKQIVDIKIKINQQQKAYSERSAHAQNMEKIYNNLKSNIEQLEAQIKQSESSGKVSSASKQMLQKQKTELIQKLAKLKEEMKKLSISQSQKQRAVELLTQHTNSVKGEIKKISSINSETKSGIDNISKRIQADAKSFAGQSAKQKEEAKARINKMEAQIKANQEKLRRLQAVLQKAVELQNELKKEDSNITKVVDDLTADIKRLGQALQKLTVELARLKQVVADTQAKIKQLNKSITSRLDGQFFKKEPSKIYSGKNIAQSKSDVEACLRLCAENPTCQGFSLSESNECILKGSVDGSKSSSQHTSYMRYSLASDRARKELDDTKSKLTECEDKKQQFTGNLDVARPRIVGGKCKLMDMEVKQWWSNGKVCFQACPSNAQDRHPDGRCKCGYSQGANQKCPAGNSCQSNKCVGNVFADSTSFNTILGAYKAPANNKAKNESPPSMKANCDLKYGKVFCPNEVAGYVLHKHTQVYKDGIYANHPVNNAEECISKCNSDSNCSGFTVQTKARRFNYQHQHVYAPWCYLTKKGMFRPTGNSLGGTTHSYFKLDPKALAVRQGEFKVKLGDLKHKGCCFTGASNFGLASNTNCFASKECLRMGISVLDLWTKSKAMELLVSYKPASTYVDSLNDNSATQKPFAQYNGKDVYFVRIN
jgi:hypothetical protein